MTSSNQNNLYDKTEVYKNRLKKLVIELKLICNTEKIPMFVTFAVANDAQKTTYVHDMVLASTGRTLSENRIAKILLYLNRFETELPSCIRRDISELESYLEQADSVRKRCGSVDLALADDKLSDLSRIAEGLSAVSISAHGTLSEEV